MGLSMNAMSNIQQKMSTNSSRSSSPKDNKAINRLYQMTLKNIIIYFVNIIDYKDLYTKTNNQSQFSQFLNQNIQGQPSQMSPVDYIFNKVLVNKFSDEQESPLMTLDDIKRYKATNFEDFPEFFSNEIWKVTFFHSDEINSILRVQINQEMIDKNFFTRRLTYAKGINEMSQRSEKMKDEIQKRINADTLQKISVLTEKAYNHMVRSKIQVYVQE